MVGGPLAAPWGITIAPANFGPFSGDLLVGNFSSLASEINAFDPLNGTFLGTIPINVGIGNTAGGLWSLGFGTGGSNGSPNTLFFTDEINGINASLRLASASDCFTAPRAAWRPRRRAPGSTTASCR
jgi:hypothetical protein